jgi:hypothetical protein
MHPSSAATVYSSVAEAMLLGQHPHQALFCGSHCLTVLQLQCLARQSRATRKGARGSWGTRNKTIVVRENGLQLDKWGAVSHRYKGPIGSLHEAAYCLAQGLNPKCWDCLTVEECPAVLLRPFG